MLLSTLLTLFTVFSFFRQPLDRLWGDAFGNTLFGIALASGALALTAVAWRRKIKTPNELVSVPFVAWFLVWETLSRDAKRYDFFIGVPSRSGLPCSAVVAAH